MNQPRTEEDALFARIADRYERKRNLGRGGMAVVYEVIERSSGARLALKRLLVTDSVQDRAHLAVLFEQEFHTLSQLAHPRVVRVHDFVRLDDEAFYTMELLDGGDLTELAPLPWQRVCALLIDVCSALSLLHSRSLVHRDLTPRNVRCTTEGTAKLIDFGAMLRFGPAKRLVGTPAYIAPEALDGQPLDGRADLFALGATAYYALTGQHAFPARSIAAARDAHAFRPPPPSAVVAEIPAALDRLVMALLLPSPLARPSSAAEVMEQLSVIAGQPIDEQLAIRSAYLSSPSLVGRDVALARARKQAERALQGQGSSLLVSGPPGVGRTRFVEACTLEAKLVGACVLRANAADGSAGDFGGAKALAEQLLDSMPEIALQQAVVDAAVLAHVIPKLLAMLAQATPEAPPLQPAQFASTLERRSRVQTALRDWIKRIASERCLLIAVDDFQQLDEPSCALVAILAHEARSSRLLIVASSDSSDNTDNHTGKDALRLLSQTARSIRLKPLELADTEALLLSVFGDVPNVRLVANRLHEMTHGNPRELMQLAQHLVTDRIIGYAAGVWSLPSELRRADLPQAALDTLSGGVPKLPDAARMLAQAMALCQRRSLSFQDCVILVGAETPRVLDALISADIVANDSGQYRLTSANWQRVLTQDLTAQQTQTLHARLANLVCSDEHERFHSVQHLWRAGASAQALQLMLAHVRTVEERYNSDNDWFYEYVRMLPSDWLETCQGLLTTSATLQSPKSDRFVLVAHVVGCAPAAGRSCPELLSECAAMLYEASGLSCYKELGADGDPATRLHRALTLAQQRYDALPEHERILPVGDAIPRMARCILHAIATVGRSSDYALMASMPSLEAYVPLSPLVAAIQRNAEATLQAVGGRFELAREGYLAIKQTLEQAGEVTDARQHMMYMAVMYAIGAIETGVGIEGGERWAERISSEPLFEVNAWRLRLMAALRQGDFDKAQQLRQKLELIRIQNSPPQLFEGTLLWVEALCYSLSDDLARVKQVISGIEAMTTQLPKWRPFLHYARGQYQRLRGDQAQALAEFETGLKLVQPGQHMSWSALAGACVWGLHVTGRADQAVEAGQRYFAEAEANGLRAAAQPILQSLALAQAARGEFEPALATGRLSVAVIESIGTSGIGLASAFETLARIAILMKDRAAFDQHAARCAQLYRAGNNPSLTAKYERLLYDARTAMGDGKRRSFRAGERTEQRLQTIVSTALRGCDDLDSRAKQALQLLLEHTECTGGYLYVLERDGLALRAQLGSQAPAKDMDELASAHVAAELDEAEEVTATGDGDTGLATMWASAEGRFVPLLLAHTGEQGRLVTGLALFYVSSEQVFASPGALVPVLSRALVETGDVFSALAPH